MHQICYISCGYTSILRGQRWLTGQQLYRLHWACLPCMDRAESAHRVELAKIGQDEVSQRKDAVSLRCCTFDC